MQYKSTMMASRHPMQSQKGSRTLESDIGKKQPYLNDKQERQTEVAYMDSFGNSLWLGHEMQHFVWD